MQLSTYATASTIDAPRPERRLVKSIHIYSNGDTLERICKIRRCSATTAFIHRSAAVEMFSFFAKERQFEAVCPKSSVI